MTKNEKFIWYQKGFMSGIAAVKTGDITLTSCAKKVSIWDFLESADVQQVIKACFEEVTNENMD